MLSFPSSIRIFIARKPIDFRKAHDGLVAIIRDEFDDDPFDGSVFVFLNRNFDRVKLIHWDRDGLWLHYKRLESGKFRLRLDGDGNGNGNRVEVSRPELTMLLDGIDLKRQKIRDPFAPPKRIDQSAQRDGGTAVRSSERC
jgi:transposase